MREVANRHARGGLRAGAEAPKAGIIRPMRLELSRMSPRFGVLALLVTNGALAQGTPPTASFPDTPPATPTSAPAATPGAPTPPPATAPAPSAAPVRPPAAAPPPGAPTQPIVEPPPPPEPIDEPPPPPERPRRTLPQMSVRIDPFNLLIDGDLGIELEVAVLKFMTVELVPDFVVNDSPPTFGYLTGPHGLTRKSNGWGPLAGTSVDVGFWLQGKALDGNVIRLMFTDYGYKYAAPLDSVSHAERVLYGYFGTNDRWGAFSMEFGIGLGADLNKQRRCYVPDNPNAPADQVTFHPTNQCDENALFLRTDRTNVPGVVPPVIDLSGGLAGIRLLGRISLGVVF